MMVLLRLLTLATDVRFLRCVIKVPSAVMLAWQWAQQSNRPGSIRFRTWVLEKGLRDPHLSVHECERLARVLQAYDRTNLLRLRSGC